MVGATSSEGSSSTADGFSNAVANAGLNDVEIRSNVE